MSKIGLTTVLMLVIAGLAACGQKDERKGSRSGGNPPAQEEGDLGGNKKVKPKDTGDNQQASLAQLFGNCTGLDLEEIADLSDAKRADITSYCSDLGAIKFKQGISNILKPANIN